jgi:hypothetical protein
MRVSILAVALLALVPCASQAGTVAGYWVDSLQARSEPPTPRHESEGDYTVRVVRAAPDSAASHLLDLAECAYPSRSLLVGLAAARGYEMGADTARAPLWWCRGTRERRVPYAATRGALEHYLELTQKYRDHDYHEPGLNRIFTSELVYEATIARRNDFAVGNRTFHDVYVANVALDWTYDDGTFLPHVTARRTVVLAPAGEILAVDGDGQGTVDVSISANRGIGRERQIR